MDTDFSAATSRVWLVTGCSSGLGRALCQRVLETGDRVVVTARNTASIADLVAEYPGHALPLTLDVTDPGSIAAAVDQAVARAGRIDVLVNNAGYGIVGALEEIDETEGQRVFDANVFGTYRVIRALLPHMRGRHAGHILNISSMGGLVAGAGFAFYNATKFAVEGMSEALALEVAPFGIKVTIVEPGPFRTDFRSRSMYSAPPMDAYAETVGCFRKAMAETDGKQPGDPRRAADAMIAAVNAAEPPLHLPLGEICVQAIRRKLFSVGQEIDRWEAVSLATSFLPAAAT
ncbi:MAG TPA: oxidoreductase [Stellaceae bacterium]|nr:oxidoreductase [Stellaceae bacterium]